MKKARKIRINGEDFKYFVDKGAKDERDENTFIRVILYAPNNIKHYWNLDPKDAINRCFYASEIKRAYLEGKFK